ncbi:MAG TPA: phosphatase PAP2 family protein [Candidatus Binataceae bacterium]|nr:phosphatase PAP2 family protein [Candidatus Binataceae bacterium]
MKSRVSPASVRAALAALVLTMIVGSSQPPWAANSGWQGVGDSLVSDFKYVANNLEADGEDIVTAPLDLDAAAALLANPRFYLVLGGAGAAFGGSFALDQTMRRHLHNMSSSTASTLENISYGSVGAATALLYGYGLYAGEARARQYALTAGEGAGIAVLLDIGIKAAFGRLRPSQDHHDHDAFFHGGQTFVSGDVAPLFALACGVSEYYDNRWYVALPAYSLALLDGFGRMGHDAHWFSDVVGAALLGVGTTELFLHLHRRHEEHPWRFRIFPMPQPAVPAAKGVFPVTAAGARRARRDPMPAGLVVAFWW